MAYFDNEMASVYETPVVESRSTWGAFCLWPMPRKPKAVGGGDFTYFHRRETHGIDRVPLTYRTGREAVWQLVFEGRRKPIRFEE